MADSGARRFLRITLQVTARAAGLSSVAFMIQHWRLDGFPPLQTLSQYILVAVLALAMIGLLMGWASDGLGGFVLLVLGGCSAGIVYTGMATGQANQWSLVYAAPIVGTGLLHLVAWMSKGQSSYRLPRPGGGRPPDTTGDDRADPDRLPQTRPVPAIRSDTASDRRAYQAPGEPPSQKQRVHVHARSQAGRPDGHRHRHRRPHAKSQSLPKADLVLVAGAARDHGREDDEGTGATNDPAHRRTLP